MQYIKILLVAIVLTSGVQGISQSKFKEINFRVEGKCDMCEKRIENALDIKGIKVADWDVTTKNCRVFYKTTLYSEEEIHQLIADLGHTTEKIKATKQSYDNLHGCCKY